jgi:hypothetical protein
VLPPASTGPNLRQPTGPDSSQVRGGQQIELAGHGNDPGIRAVRGDLEIQDVGGAIAHGRHDVVQLTVRTTRPGPPSLIGAISSADGSRE